MELTMIILVVYVLFMIAFCVAARHTDNNRLRTRTADSLRIQLVSEIADVQTLAITSLKASPEYLIRVNQLLDRATEIVRTTNLAEKHSLQNLQGGLALVSQARAIVLGASAR